MDISLKELLKKTVGGFITVFALDFLLMFYAPLELFFTNRREFWFDLIDMLPQLLQLLCCV